MDEIASLRRWFLEKLRAELVRSRPEFVAAFDAATPDARLVRSMDRWGGLLGDPIEPWPRLLGALLDLEVGLDHVEFAVQALENAVDGRTAHFFVLHAPVVMRAAIDRLRYLVVRCERSGVVDKEVGGQLRVALEELPVSPRLETIRHEAVHGAFTSPKESAIGEGERERVWEPIAWSGSGGDDIIDQLYAAGALFRDEWAKGLRNNAGVLVTATKRLLTTLEEAAVRKAGGVE